eukprot:TRINITY_DN361_c0_g1_i4.p1 TRINITY_DN361_c0_g1~~TRINITY_DN361_c0_g1_i4.p1  ORF type:complete len:201 (+),score=64.78 TRINITY_DN361_c0_g1_i4:96-698(+)
MKEEKVLDVEIEKGMKEDEEIVFKGMSHEITGYLAGDVILVVKVMSHPIFKRKDNHLVIDQTIPLVNALTGYCFTVQHLDGRKLYISTPPNTIISPGTQLEVPDEGLPVRKWISERGVLIVHFDVQFPTYLDPGQVNSLTKILPDLMPAPSYTNDHVKVVLQQVDEENVDREDTERSRNPCESDSEEETHAAPGVTCAQQ